MKKSFLILTFLFAASAAIGEKAEYSASSKVYVCTGGYATKYHKTSKCRGLGNCKAEIVSVTEESAIRDGRTRCGICY